jgi:hypothetical protein
MQLTSAVQLRYSFNLKFIIMKKALKKINLKKSTVMLFSGRENAQIKGGGGNAGKSGITCSCVSICGTCSRQPYICNPD